MFKTRVSQQPLQSANLDQLMGLQLISDMCDVEGLMKFSKNKQQKTKFIILSENFCDELSTLDNLQGWGKFKKKEPGAFPKYVLNFHDTW